MYDLHLQGVGKTYPDGTVAVSDFDLAVEAGEFVAFLGPSGCGKSTTLRMIGGFESISHGDILIKGKNISSTPPEHRPTSMIFQNYALFPHMTVRENIAFGLDVKRIPTAEKNAKLDRIMEMFELSAFADRKADRLSGGQRQRIALARGLVVEPDILLLDEPLGALDANLRRVIQNELKLLQREFGITFVFVTHAQSEALGLSDRIVVMNQGRVEQIGTPHEVYAVPETEFVARFIGSNAIIEGRILDVDRETGVVETKFGKLIGKCGASLNAGMEALVAIPAEAMKIRPAAKAGEVSENRLHGTIAMKHVVGSVAHLKVDLDGNQSVDIHASADDEELAQIMGGEAVVIDSPIDRVTLVKSD